MIIGNPVYVSGTLEMELDLLWTNASPTASFTAKTVSVDLSGYQLALIVFAPFIADNRYGMATLLCPVDGDKYSMTFTAYTSNRNGKRDATVATSGVTFSACTYNDATNNAYGIPQYIYGIKGAD